MPTRLFQMGFEQGLIEANMLTPGSTSPTLSSVKKQTGSQSALMAGATQASIGRSIPATSEIRAYAALNHNGTTGPGSASVDRQVLFFYLVCQDNAVIRVGWQTLNNLFYLTKASAGTAVASASGVSGGISAVDTWHQLSLNIKVGVSGTLNLHINGIAALSYSGSGLGTSPIVGVLFCGCITNNAVWTTGYLDNCYVDDITGESPSIAPPRFFDYKASNADGSPSNLSGSDGNSVDNYALVDEVGLHDGDTTYLFAVTAAVKQALQKASYATPAGHSVLAVIPSVIARKTDGAVATTLKIGVQKGGSEGLSSALALAATYDIYQNRITTLPDASTLNDANINTAEVLLESAGAYA